MQASINIATLKAVNLAASPKGYYMKGVYVEVTEKTVTYTAMNGYLLISRREDSAEPNTLTGSWTIPSDFIKGCKPERGTDHATMTLLPEAGAGSMLAFTGTITGMAAPIAGTFKDYRRIIPATVDGKPGQFDGNCTWILAKFAKALGRQYFHIHHNGESAAPVTFGLDGTFAVLAPVRNKLENKWDAEAAVLSPDEREARAQAAHAAEKAREAA